MDDKSQIPNPVDTPSWWIQNFWRQIYKDLETNPIRQFLAEGLNTDFQERKRERNCRMGRCECQTASSSPQQENLRCLGQWQGLSQGDGWDTSVVVKWQCSSDLLYSHIKIQRDDLVRTNLWLNQATWTPDTHERENNFFHVDHISDKRTYRNFPSWLDSLADTDSGSHEDTRSHSCSQWRGEQVEQPTYLTSISVKSIAAVFHELKKKKKKKTLHLAPSEEDKTCEQFSEIWRSFSALEN